MGKDEIAFKVKIDTGAGKQTIGELKQEFKDLKNILDTTTKGTEKYNETLLKLGDVRGSLNGLKKDIIALDPGNRLSTIATAGSNIASGFAAAQGAAALLGNESEEVQKTLLKVQAAMALSEGLKGLKDLGKGFKVLGAIIKSNPIFLFASIIIAIGTAMFALRKSIKPLGDAFEFIGDVIGVVVDAIKEFLDWIGLTSFAIDEATDSQMAAMKSQGDAVQERYDREIKMAQAAGKSTVEIEKKKQQALIETAQLQGKLLIEAALARGSWADGEEARITEYIKTVRDATFEIELIEIKETKTKEDEAKKRSDIHKKTVDDKVKREQDAADKLRAIELALINQRNANDLAELEATKALVDRIADLKDTSLEDDRNRELIKLEEEYLKTDQSLVAYQAFTDAKALIDADYQEKKTVAEKDVTAKKEALDRESMQNSIAMAQATTDGLQSLSDLFFQVKTANLQKGSAAELRAAKQQFKINKALAISNATIQGVQAVLNAYSSGSAIPIVGAVTGPLFAALAGITVAANIAKIGRSKFDIGGSGGGGSVGSIPSVSAPSIAPPSQGGTQLNPNGTIKQADNNTPTIKAIVVETDITKTQKKVGVIETNSKL